MFLLLPPLPCRRSLVLIVSTWRFLAIPPPATSSDAPSLRLLLCLNRVRVEFIFRYPCHLSCSAHSLRIYPPPSFNCAIPPLCCLPCIVLCPSLMLHSPPPSCCVNVSCCCGVVIPHVMSCWHLAPPSLARKSVSHLDSFIMALPGCQGFRDSVKRSQLGCYTGSSVWGRVKGVPGVKVAEV